jgi:SET domain-containing protein
VTAEQRADPDYDTTYVFSYWTAKGEEVWVDAKDAYCSYGRYANDPRDEAKTNAKIVRRGNRIILVATAEILPGEEILIDYGYEYWLDKLGTLTPLQAEEVRQEEELRQRRS